MARRQNQPMQSQPTCRGARLTLSQRFLALTALVLSLISVSVAVAKEHQMMVRIAEIQVDPHHLAQYQAILKEEADASVRLEPGVIGIFPMYQKERDTHFRILEIYAERAAYESHLTTPHFQNINLPHATWLNH